MPFMRAGGLKTWYKKHIRIFLTTWNQLRVSLVTNGKYQPPCFCDVNPSTAAILIIWVVFSCVGEVKIPAKYCQSDMELSSDFRVLLPQRQGPGLCSTALTSYLISLHNNMVCCMDKHTGEETRWGRSRLSFPSCQRVSSCCRRV